MCQLLVLFSVLSGSVWTATLSCQPGSLSVAPTLPPGALIVRQCGAQPGDFATPNAAIRALKSKKGPQYIYIYPGQYHGDIVIDYDDPLTIQGYTSDSSSFSENTVTIRNAQGKTSGLDDAQTSSLWVKSDDVKLLNLDIKNEFGAGLQAVALTVSGERIAIRGCRIASYQDTLYLKSPSTYISASYIEGTIDFIFGTGPAFIEGTTIAVKKPVPPSSFATITAQKGRGKRGNGIFVFNRCSIIGLPGTTPHIAFLGRPWADDARVVFEFSEISDVVKPEGWTIWQKGNERTENVEFLEYRNEGPGSQGLRQIGTQSSHYVSIENVLNSASWIN